LLVGFASALGACSFSVDAVTDARPPDASSEDAPEPDAPLEPARVSANLIALWTLDETEGLVARTSGGTPPLDLKVRQGTVAWTAGAMTLAAQTELGSDDPAFAIVSACNASHEVTFEAWVKPSSATPVPVVIAGIAPNTGLRNVSLFQIDGTWRARVRTNRDQDGQPELTTGPMSIDTTSWTHLVVVADSTQRALYVDGAVADYSEPAGPLNWENYPMQLGAERDGTPMWPGAFALVAIYDRGLSPEEVMMNFTVGPNPDPPSSALPRPALPR
jgi:hypothetical protein